MPGQFVDSIINENLKVAAEYFKATVSNLEKNPNSGGTIGFIPFKMSCILDGISGIKIYNELNINTNFLPTGYTKTTKFIVTGVDHKLSNGDWETSLNLTLISNASNIGIITRDIALAKRKLEIKSSPVKIEKEGEGSDFSFTGGTFVQNLVKILEDERKLWLPAYKETSPPPGHGSYNPTDATAWSSRFISWAIQTAGKDIWSPTIPKFSTYQKHSSYVNQAKINKEGNKGYFKAYKYDETPVQLGDILTYSHDGGTWDANGTNTHFAGHGDICTKIESDYAWCIGGNLSNTVKYAKYKLTSTNYLQVGGSGGKPTDFYTGQNRPKGSSNDVFQAIIRFTLP